MKHINFNPEAPAIGYWDQQLLLDIASDLDDNIIVIPARQNTKYVDQINEEIAKLDYCLIILTGDEENDFPVDKLIHKNKIVYQMTPINKSNFVDRYIPNGYSPAVKHIKKLIRPEYRWSFAGQVTHKRRKMITDELEKLENGVLVKTEGFTQGLPPEQYMKLIEDSRIVICPSGPIIADTFRLYETLEAGRTPIVDKNSYWSLVFDDFPVPQIEHVSELKDMINYHNDTYPQKANECFAWWQLYKRNLRKHIIDDINLLKGKPNMEGITVLIPTSPVMKHPLTDDIEVVINSVRDRLPDAEIIVMFDGIREEQVEYKTRYEEYKRRLLFKINMMKGVVPFVFSKHSHQAEMTRRVVNMIDTDLILFVEHDTPLCEDIPFDKLSEIIRSKKANMIRLHHEALILDEHKHLMLPKEIINGLPMIKTGQWSQRPHLVSKGFYQNILSRFFSEKAKTMIEDRIHGFVHEAFVQRGLAGWNEFKVMIYAPDGDMKRSYHLDSRGTDSKFDMVF